MFFVAVFVLLLVCFFEFDAEKGFLILEILATCANLVSFYSNWLFHLSFCFLCFWENG